MPIKFFSVTEELGILELNITSRFCKIKLKTTQIGWFFCLISRPLKTS